MSLSNAIRHNIIRLQILKILAPEYPKTIDFDILRRVLANWGYALDKDKLAGYLAYLTEKGCVRVEVKSDFGFTLVSITSNGLDVLDGRRPECGIEV